MVVTTSSTAPPRLLPHLLPKLLKLLHLFGGQYLRELPIHFALQRPHLLAILLAHRAPVLAAALEDLTAPLVVLGEDGLDRRHLILGELEFLLQLLYALFGIHSPIALPLLSLRRRGESPDEGESDHACQHYSSLRHLPPPLLLFAT
jgi:hypothetical protein